MERANKRTKVIKICITYTNVQKNMKDITREWYIKKLCVYTCIYNFFFPTKDSRNYLHYV